MAANVHMHFAIDTFAYICYHTQQTYITEDKKDILEDIIAYLCKKLKEYCKESTVYYKCLKVIVVLIVLDQLHL